MCRRHQPVQLWPRFYLTARPHGANHRSVSGPNFASCITQSLFEKETFRIFTCRRTRLLAPRRNPTHGALRHRACRNSAIVCPSMAIRVAGFMPHAPPGPAQHMLATSMHVPCASPGHRATIRLTCGQLIILSYAICVP